MKAEINHIKGAQKFNFIIIIFESESAKMKFFYLLLSLIFVTFVDAQNLDFVDGEVAGNQNVKGKMISFVHCFASGSKDILGLS